MRLVEGEPDQVDEEGLVFAGELDVPEGERSVMGSTVAVEVSPYFAEGAHLGEADVLGFSTVRARGDREL